MTAPMRLLEIEIPAEWVDYNDHLNDAYHALAFSRAGDAFMERLGLGEAEREAPGRTEKSFATNTSESHYVHIAYSIDLL